MYSVAPMSKTFQSCVAVVFVRFASVSVSTQSLRITCTMFCINLWHIVMLSSFLFCSGTYHERRVVFYINTEVCGILNSVAAVISCFSPMSSSGCCWTRWVVVVGGAYRTCQNETDVYCMAARRSAGSEVKMLYRYCNHITEGQLLALILLDV